MIPIEQVPEIAQKAWTRLRDDLVAILDEDLFAMWAYGGTTSAKGGGPLGDLDTFVVLCGLVGPKTVQGIIGAQTAIANEQGVEWDTWYLLEADARRAEMPRHAWLDRRNENWAIDRAHLLAGRYVLLHGPQPADILAPPTAEETRIALVAEVGHLEHHVAAGDTDPFEATYAFLNGSRIIRAIETGDAAISKREAGQWGREHLPSRWHPALGAAMRAYDGQATPDDEAILAREMAPYVAMVRERISSDG